MMPMVPESGDSGLPELEQRLERGEVIYYPVCPFLVPAGDDCHFLLDQELGRGHKNISYTPGTDRVRGYRARSTEQPDRLRALLAEFSVTTTHWLGEVLPRYRDAWKTDQVSFRPQEEAGRVARLKARNDLLHVDAFPNRPTNGARILRVFVNLNPSEPRVWITGAPFAQLLEWFGEAVGLPRQTSWGAVLRETSLALFRPGQSRRTPYDEFMLRFHDFLKANSAFQKRTSRREWTFPPGSAWLVMTDTCSHAVLRGRYALEHSYFVSPSTLALPDESPAALLARASGRSVLHQAA
jgi:hypothetical protein